VAPRNLIEALCDGPFEVDIHNRAMPSADKPLPPDTPDAAENPRPVDSAACAKGLSIVYSIDGLRHPFSFGAASSSPKMRSGRW
jgi:hypothetical protein